MIQYVVDAFAERVFEGNPAAVCLPERWPLEEEMQSIARENNLSETAFAVREGEDWRLRWFTPGGEIDLCGHATLAAAYAILRFADPEAEMIRFHTMSGLLTVRREGELLSMDFPAYSLTRTEVTDAMEDALGIRPREAWLARDLVCVFDDPAAVEKIQPDLEKVRALEGTLLHVTAPGTGPGYDCVSRSFAPKLGVPEDPVCGSGHCHLAPYWSGRLGKTELTARQASRRGGTLYCRVNGDRVVLAGRAVLYAVSRLTVGEAEAPPAV